MSEPGPPGGPGPDPRVPLPSSSPSFAERQRDARLLSWRLVRLPLVALLGWFFVAQVVLGRPWVFLDNVNLFLHEGGHAVFRVFGSMTVHILGGTLTQLALPLAFGVYFWRWRGDPYAALVLAFWVGQNLLGISRYMADAVDMALPLVGGEVHDWNYLFERVGGLGAARPVAGATWLLGVLLELVTLVVLAALSWTPSDELLEGDYRRAMMAD